MGNTPDHTIKAIQNAITTLSYKHDRYSSQCEDFLTLALGEAFKAKEYYEEGEK